VATSPSAATEAIAERRVNFNMVILPKVLRRLGRFKLYG